MNDRIKKLKEQATSYTWNGDGVTEELDEVLFAQLIIQDCIDCVDGYTKPRTFGTHYDAVEQIKAHFGVKE